MLYRNLIGGAVLAAVAACQPAPPDDTRFGAGFDRTFDQQRVNGGSALETVATPQPRSVQTSNIAPPPQISDEQTGSAQNTAAETAALLRATAANSGVAPVQASPSNPPPAVVDSTTGISRENSFDAVTGQRSIESDAARIASNRAQYQVIHAEDLPQRTETGPNIVAYALSTSNPVGTSVYPRRKAGASAKYNRNCSQYKHQDQAQIDFLKAGGPKKDPQGLDPDGDGYACKWNPAPFRSGG